MKRRTYSENLKKLAKEVLPDMTLLHRALEQGGNENYIKDLIEAELNWNTLHANDAKRVEISNKIIEILKEISNPENNLEFCNNKIQEAEQITMQLKKSYTDKINSINTLLNLFLEESHC